ncbi:ATP-binding cassette domain-containing protein [Psychrobacter sp. I-STPA6b]|uniref:ATP-binding cassette domain-containing protein n=1 Tax=Psychrobacter sp. I-STPA6b TaxID=2585718 RepID=UPI001D0C7E8B|nr:ATP-binding cassette domain-containing protein [Psychrobacter sp. I-STPA6b]
MSQIRLSNISKVYDARPATANKILAMMAQGADSIQVKEQTGYSVGLYDINLTIDSGELHCIMGLSGSGKSTLVRHINRLIDPTTGEIWIDSPLNPDGTAINILTLNDKALQKFRQSTVSMVFQHFGLVPHMTVVQNVAYGLRVRGVKKSQRHEIARHWLNEVGLDGLEDSYPDELSGGMQQRVGLARALAVDTPIMLMDEAFSALDPLIRNQLQDQLLELQSKLKKTIVFITHDIDEAIKVGQRISILNQGRLVQTGTAMELKNNPVNDYIAEFMNANT